MRPAVRPGNSGRASGRGEKAHSESFWAMLSRFRTVKKNWAVRWLLPSTGPSHSRLRPPRLHLRLRLLLRHPSDLEIFEIFTIPLLTIFLIRFSALLQLD